MTKVKVTFENIAITNNGEPSGKGETYWLFQVDGETIAFRRDFSGGVCSAC